MVLRLVSLLLAALAGTSFLLKLAGETDPQKLWALVVGISNYSHAEPLSYAATDAQAFSDFLQSFSSR